MFSRKMSESHLRKSDILSKDAAHLLDIYSELFSPNAGKYGPK